MRKLKLMILSFEHLIVVYIDHDVNISIVNQIKLISSNMKKLNMKLVRASTYLSQFRLLMYHRFEKSNIVFDVLNRLSSNFDKRDDVNDLNVDSYHDIEFVYDIVYAFNQAIVIMIARFRERLQKEYKNNLD